MPLLDYEAVLALSENEVSRSVRLTSFSMALLLSWLKSTNATFNLTDLTDAERDSADALFSRCVKELMVSAFVGMVFYSMDANTPDGCLDCSYDNHYELMADWPELMEIYPAVLKNIPASGAFYVPNFSGHFLTGAGTSMYGRTFGFLANGGADAVTLTEAQIPAHTHGESIAVPAVINGGLEAPASAATPSTGVTGSAGGGQAHENMPPFGVLKVYMVGR